MSASLWACLRLADPALAAVQRRLATLPERLAVLDGPPQRPQVLACSDGARRTGVRPGLGLPAARALCPDLVALPRDAGAEQALWQLLGAWAYGFSDQVSLALPDAVVLEVGGSLRLFRGWPALERQLRGDLAQLGLAARLALAPRPRAAWVLAGLAQAASSPAADRTASGVRAAPSPAGALPATRAAGWAGFPAGSARAACSPGIGPSMPSGKRDREDAGQAGGRAAGDRVRAIDAATAAPATAVARDDALRRLLDDLPVSAAGFEPGALAAVRAMGFLRLRELAALPRDSLGRRIGAAALVQIDRLYGRAPDPLPGWQPPQGFEAVIEFDARPTAVEPLLFALRRLFAELAATLQARDGGVQRFRLVLLHEDVPATAVPVGLLRPERDPARLLELARARLERASLAAPVAGLALVADELPPFRPGLADLFAGAAGERGDWPDLLERLRARLGDEAVRHPVEQADHRPERATALLPSALPASGAPRLGARRREGGLPLPGTATVAAAGVGARACARAAAGAAARGVPAALPADPRQAASRPVWLLPRPIPLRGRPARVLSGPERLETGWWDGGDLRRDYYVIETAQGQRAWAFCPVGERDGWMLHGWFA